MAIIFKVNHIIIKDAALQMRWSDEIETVLGELTGIDKRGFDTKTRCLQTVFDPVMVSEDEIVFAIESV